MSSTPESSGSSQRRSTVSREKPTKFARTCGLLRTYLKENGGLGDLNIDMNCNGGSKDPSLTQSPVSRTMDLFPLHPSFSTSPASQEHHQNIQPARPEPQMAQMTMIYGGKVLVFNDVPPEKAEEIISIAKREASTMIFTQSANYQQTSPETRVAKTQTGNATSITATNDKNIVPSSFNIFDQDGTALIPYDLPIARRNSLLRFLEKRNKRHVGEVPYQNSDRPTAAPLMPAEGKSWLGLAPQPLQ